MSKKAANRVRAAIHRFRYKEWKNTALKKFGYFPIFQPLKETFLLRNLSGNAVKLYIYLGLMTGNETGETWVSLDTVATYFGKTKRAVSEWVKELEEAQLIERMQLKPNEVAHTFLLPYGWHRLNDPDSIQSKRDKLETYDEENREE